MIVYKLTSIDSSNGRQLVVPISFSGKLSHDWVMDINNDADPIVGITDCVWLVPGTWESA